MTTATIVGVSQLLLAMGPVPGHPVVDTKAKLGVQLQVVLHVLVDPEDLTLARQTAQALLTSAGIVTEWQECSVFVTRCDSPTGHNVITVRLMPTKVTGSPECGHLGRDSTRGPAALVHVVRHRELVRKIRHSRAGRSHPGLASLKAGHVTGLTIAHEVGHALNLSHADRGVMKGWIGADDLLALRESRLAFTPEQSVRMRQAMLDGDILSVQ